MPLQVPSRRRGQGAHHPRALKALHVCRRSRDLCSTRAPPWLRAAGKAAATARWGGAVVSSPTRAGRTSHVNGSRSGALNLSTRVRVASSSRHFSCCRDRSTGDASLSVLCPEEISHPWAAGGVLSDRSSLWSETVRPRISQMFKLPQRPKLLLVAPSRQHAPQAHLHRRPRLVRGVCPQCRGAE